MKIKDIIMKMILSFIFLLITPILSQSISNNNKQQHQAITTTSTVGSVLDKNYYNIKNNNNYNNDNNINSFYNYNGCNQDRLAVYKVVLHTYWTRDLFPKHYPDWRPPAQWTKTFGVCYFNGKHGCLKCTVVGEYISNCTVFLRTECNRRTDEGFRNKVYGAHHKFNSPLEQLPIDMVEQFPVGDSLHLIDLGRSHDASYNIFRLGKQASLGLKMFAEIGKTDSLDSEVKHRDKIYDEFTIPAISSGGGRSETNFFVDGNHSFVSLVTRIMPSPDWFIGVDSFQLCVGGSWIDSVTVEMDPLDAGTDNGFTFTAPNWPTQPQGIIYRITSRYPAHPAGSFFYPNSKRLPPIATFQFIKLKEYELSEMFNHIEDDRKYETVKTVKTRLEIEHNHIDMNNELSADIEKERQYEVTQIPVKMTEREKNRARYLAKMKNELNSSTVLLPKNNKTAILNNIATTYSTQRVNTVTYAEPVLLPYPQNRRRQKNRRLRPPKDCRVGHWSDWSPCSKSCGIGEMHRYRKVLKHAKRGGRPCPPLQESKWCGSARDCTLASNYFKW